MFVEMTGICFYNAPIRYVCRVYIHIPNCCYFSLKWFNCILRVTAWRVSFFLYSRLHVAFGLVFFFIGFDTQSHQSSTSCYILMCICLWHGVSRVSTESPLNHIHVKNTESTEHNKMIESDGLSRRRRRHINDQQRASHDNDPTSWATILLCTKSVLYSGI